MSPKLSRRTILATIPALGLMGTVSASEGLVIATSMPILQDIVASVVGDAASVFSIMPANADPHTWEPTPGDMVRLTEANAFIFFDAHLEPFVETGGWRDVVHSQSIPELQITDHIELIEITETADHGDHQHEAGDGDPHIWLDPVAIVQAVPAIAAFLAEHDADNAATYETNATKYISQLEELHRDLLASFEVIPPENRKLLVFHDAWQYFAARYDFEIVGVVLENPDGEVSARQIADLIQIIRDHDIHVVFAEPQFNTSVLNLLADEGGIEIATLLTDTFTEDVHTYIELMLFNRDQLVAYLAR